MQDDGYLAEALLALAPEQGADWGDVVERSQALQRGRGRRRTLVLAVAVAALLLVAGAAWAVGSQVFGWFSVSRFPVEAPSLPAAAGYVSGRDLHRADGDVQHLSRPLLAPLLGQEAALVVPSPSGRYVAYHAWTRDSPNSGTPLLVVHDTATGSDRLLTRGAQTLAWRRDGRIAYFRADRPRYDGRFGAYLGEVVVQSLHGTPRAWTHRPGGYSVLAWAGHSLLVGVAPCFFPNCRHDPTPGVYALNSAGALRPLHLATLAALSPDGRYAFGRYDPAGQDSPSPLVRVVRIEDGQPVATVNLLRPLRRAGLRGPLPGSLLGASWRGDEIAATVIGRDSALVLFRVRAGEPAIEEILRIPPAALPARHGVSFGIPLLTGRENGKIVVTARGTTSDDRSLVAVLACSRTTRSCVRGRVLPTRRWFAVVDNPSRPWIRRRG
jgi:hypothetical protein